MKEKNVVYHNLKIWQKSRKLVLVVYKLTEKFPSSEMYGLTSQMRRAVISVVLNIVEGDRRSSRKEFLRFLDIAEGSLTELEACLELALDLAFITKEEYQQVEDLRKEVAVMIRSFIKSVQKTL